MAFSLPVMRLILVSSPVYVIFFLVLPPLIPHVRSFPRAPLGQSARQVFLVYRCSRLECSGTSAGFYLNRSNLERLIPVYSRFMTVSQKCIVRMYHEWSPSKESSSGSTLFRRAPWRDSALTPLLSCGCPIYSQSRKLTATHPDKKILQTLPLFKLSFRFVCDLKRTDPTQLEMTLWQ